MHMNLGAAEGVGTCMTIGYLSTRLRLMGNMYAVSARVEGSIRGHRLQFNWGYRTSDGDFGTKNDLRVSHYISPA